MKHLPSLSVAALWLGAAALALAGESNQFKFSFGTGQSTPGYTLVAPVTPFKAETGYGFERGASVTAHERFVTSDKPFLFSVKLPEGNYRMAVTLGDDAEDSTTTVKAEARRLMLENVRAAKGQVVQREFTVNIRTPRISAGNDVRLKQREKDSEQVTWDDRLTLEFNGARACLRTLEIIPAPDVPTVFVAGDSTVCDQPLEPWNSWGQMVPRFFQAGVAVANYAQSGESIKSSIGARRFEKIFSVMKPGDWLLVQFGHNDMKDRAPDALDTYRANLKRIVAQTRAKGGTPVLITSMERKAGVKALTLAGYPEAVRAIAREEKVAMIDLQAMSVVLYQALGANLDRAFQDGTHHNNYGSYLLAKCVAAGIAKAGLPLAKHLMEEVKSFDPAKPDPIEQFNVPPSSANSTAKPDGN